MEKELPRAEQDQVDNEPDDVIEGDEIMTPEQIDQLIEQEKNDDENKRKKRQFSTDELKWPLNVDVVIDSKIGTVKFRVVVKF